MSKRNKLKQLINTIEIARRNNQKNVTIDMSVALEAMHELNSLLLDDHRPTVVVQQESEYDAGNF